MFFFFFFFNATATTEIYTLSLHDALPIWPPRAAAAAPLIGLALGLRSRDFWLLAGSFFICGLSTNGLIGTHLIPASMEHGIPEVMAASLLASIGLLDIIVTTVSGWLSARWDNRY